ncbi:MAG: glutaredoxin 2 [Neisseria sp.]|nr:glutaredoxin 2 [Neisseria sp.]
MKLYIYDHCPFCMRARMVFRLKNAAVEETVLAADDEATPIGLIGVKQLPILQKPDGSHMGESLDIVRFADEHSGGARLADNIRPEMQAWLDGVSEYQSRLVFPRCIKLGLPEFAEQSAVDYFVQKKEKSIGSFAAHLNKTGQYVRRLNADLVALEDLISGYAPFSLHGNASDESFSDGLDFGMEDIVLFPVLRNLTMVRGAVFPPKVAEYLWAVAERCGVDLYFDRAL